MPCTLRDTMLWFAPIPRSCQPETKCFRSDRELSELGYSDETIRQARDTWFSLLHVSADDTFKNIARAEYSPGAAYKAVVYYFKSATKNPIA